MPSSPILPASGSNIVASGQVVNRYNLLISNSVFGNDDPFKKDVLRDATATYVVGLPRIFVSILLFPEYDRGDVNFVARPWIAWRVVGTTGGVSQPGYDSVSTTDYTPLTTPQILPIGQPISSTLLAGGLISVAVEFDTTAFAKVPNPSQNNRGYDRVVVTISASQ